MAFLHQEWIIPIFAYKQFTQTLKTVAKQTIPRGFRKSYIPTWDEECSRPYKEYLNADSPDTIQSSTSALTDLLDKKRHDLWIDTVSNIDFTHTSRKAWKTVKRLTGTVSAKTMCPISPDDIGRQVVRNGLTESKDRTFERQIIKKLKTLQLCNADNPDLRKQLTIEEVKDDLNQLKLWKSPGPDSIHNEFLVNLGENVITWLTLFINTSFYNNRILRMRLRASAIVLLKPGKVDTSPKSYRPISLVCTTFKLTERIILNRINSIVEQFLPHEQAVFRRGRSLVDQVACLTQNIEQAYDDKNVGGAIFLDLTAAYDTAWHLGLHLKPLKVLACQPMINFIMELLHSRSFVLYTSDGQASRPFRTKNGVAQGSVLAPCLYNIYTADFPETSAKRSMYVDDVALTASAPTFREAELALSHDISVLNAHLTKWNLRLSVEKTVCSVFHPKNHSANYQLNVKFKPNVTVKIDSYSSYLGICLDRSLLFRTQLNTLKKRALSRVALIKRLAGVGWGASFKALRISCLALAFAPAEYCAPVWCRSAHTKHIDVLLDESMRVITGCLRSTPSSFLPILSGITHLRQGAVLYAWDFTPKPSIWNIFYTKLCT